ILEYTSGDNAFHPDHEKIILRLIEGHPCARVLDLLRLDQAHLAGLVARYGGTGLSLTSEYYARWNGNLRSLLELKYRVGVGRSLTSSADGVLAIADVSKTLEARFHAMPPLEQMIVALCLAHLEPIHEATLAAALLRAGRPFLRREFDAALSQLEAQPRI